MTKVTRKRPTGLRSIRAAQNRSGQAAGNSGIGVYALARPRLSKRIAPRGLAAGPARSVPTAATRLRGRKRAFQCEFCSTTPTTA